MSLKQAYMRKFVILDEQSINYLKANNQKPKGHAKLEVRDDKGKITLNVDGLNPNISDEKVYKGFMLANEKSKLTQVDVGSIFVNSSGRGSVEWKFNPLSVGGTGVSIENFNVILVKLCSKNKRDDELVVPLAGYIQNADSSVSMILNKLEKDLKHGNKIEPKYPQEEKSIDISKAKEDYENEESNEIQENEESNEIQENEAEEIDIREMKIEEVKEAESIEEIQEIQETQTTHETYETEKVNGEEEIQKQNSYNYNTYNDNNYGHSINRSNTYIESARNYSKQIANYAMNILKFFERVNPFNELLEGYKWWKIEYDSKNIYRGFLPFYNYLVNMYYPYPFMTKITTCQSLIKKHNHYIFGVVEGEDEVQYYVYGVPGRFTREDQPYNGATGFTTWLRNKERSEEDMGYWLIYIDALSGKIVTPLNPTIPPK